MIVSFGKYKGQEISDVLLRDKEYVRWGAENLTSPFWRRMFKEALQNSPTYLEVEGEKIPSDRYFEHARSWQESMENCSWEMDLDRDAYILEQWLQEKEEFRFLLDN